MIKFCCDDFRWRYETAPGMGLNVRVARIIEKSKPGDTSFFITEGYTEDSAKVKFCKINFCPFCGKNLAKFYKNDKSIVNSKIEEFAKL